MRSTRFRATCLNALVAIGLFFGAAGGAGLPAHAKMDDAPGPVPKLPAASVEAPLPAFVNGDFSAGDVGAVPLNWTVRTPGYVAQLRETGPADGVRSVAFRKAATNTRSARGGMSQRIDAAPYRGKRILFSAMIRATSDANAFNGATLVLRVDRPNGQPGFSDDMSNRPIHAPQWRRYRVFGDVASDAVQIALGFQILGDASAEFAQAEIQVLGEAGYADTPAAPLSDRGAENLVALARVINVVRFFHATQEQRALDSDEAWERFLIAAVERVEAAGDAAELAAALRDVLLPIAPRVQIWAGTMKDAPPALAWPAEATHGAGFVHRGVRLAPRQEQELYSSEVVLEPVSPRPDNAKLPAADAPWTGELPGGVSARVPIVLPARDGVPLAIAGDGAGASKPVLKRPEWWSPSGLDRGARLVGVIRVWGVMQHFYPYDDVTANWAEEWAAALPTALRAAAVDTDDVSFDRTLSRLVHHLHDGHGSVIPPRRAPGAWLPVRWWWAGEELVISAEVAGAENTKLHRGDVVTAINGVPLADRIATLSSEISSATDRHRRTVLAGMLHNVPMGPSATLTVRRADNTVATVTISTDGPYMADDAADRPTSGTQVAPGVFYVNLAGLDESELKPMLAKIGRGRGLVVDLRGYPNSGALTVLRHVSRVRFESAKFGVPITTRPDRQGRTYDESGRWDMKPLTPRLSMPVAWITDGRAISYAESILGIVEAYGLGDIVGEATAGTNGNINPFTVAGGYTIWWTGMRVLKHDGTRHHSIGILPTVRAEPTREGIAAGRDELLETAIATVQKKAAEPAKVP
jgi:C-terminal processing protease CtpA/Prc